MKLTIVNFSLRKNGNCEQIMNYLISLYNSPGNQITSMTALNIHPCGICRYECFAENQSCPYLEDDASKLYGSICDSDLTYYIMPNYGGYPNALFYAFCERGHCYYHTAATHYEAYCNAKKKFIIVSNTHIRNFESILADQLAEGDSPEFLILSAKAFGSLSLAGNLMDSTAARDRITAFTRTNE